MKKLETITEICPFMNQCAIEYGSDPVCQDENAYGECSIYRDYKKRGEKDDNFIF